MNKDTLLGKDYRLFQNTPAWTLAKAVEDQDENEISHIITNNYNVVNYQEPVYGQTLLQLAVENEQYAAVKYLLANGANPNIPDKDYGDTPLFEAAKIGYGTNHSDSRFLKILLEYKADPNFVQKGPKKARNTPLMTACDAGNLEYIKILVESGASVNFVNEYGDSAIENAAFAVSVNGNPEIILYLIGKGADVRRPLYKTIPEGESKYLTDVMRTWRFDLWSAKYRKKMKIAQYLKKKGMDYWKTPVPKEYVGDYSEDYLKKY